MSVIPKQGIQIYIGRPWQHWGFGIFIVTLLSMFFVMAIREGTPLLTWQAWPAYAVSAIFSPIALLMLSFPAISVRIDETLRDLIIMRYRLVGRGTVERLPVSAVQSVDVRAIDTNDGETYHVDILGKDSNRRTVTTQQINSRTRAEAIAASIRAGIEAARRPNAPVSLRTGAITPERTHPSIRSRSRVMAGMHDPG
jgi:hypothetical protein